MWNTCSISDGASDRYRPPSAHTAMNTGRPRTKSARARTGIDTRGTSEASAPGRGVTVSGIHSTTAAPTANTMASTPNTSITGWAVNLTAMPVSNAPTASPARGETLVIIAPRRLRDAGAASTTAALNAPLAMPVATPCTMRAPISPAMSSASTKSPIATACSTSAPSTTGRRPMWSDSDPATSSEISNAIA